MPLRRLTPSAATVFIFGGLFAYTAMAAVVDPLVLRDVFNNVTLGVTVTIATTWMSAAWRAYREGADEGEWQLILGIFLWAVVLSMQRVYAIASVELERPSWLVEGPLAGFVPYSIALVGLLFLVAPGVADPAQPKKYWRHIIFAVALGAAVAGFMLGRTLPPL